MFIDTWPPQESAPRRGAMFIDTRPLQEPARRSAMFIDTRPLQEPARRSARYAAAARAAPWRVRCSLAIPFSPRRGRVAQPRVAVLGYPGKRTTIAQPQRGYGSVPHTTLIPILRCACAAVPEAHLADVEGRNPFRVGTQSAVVPKVAEYGNLGLSDATPSG